jgi:hypothetical protein
MSLACCLLPIRYHPSLTAADNDPPWGLIHPPHSPKSPTLLPCSPPRFLCAAKSRTKLRLIEGLLQTGDIYWLR